MTKERLEQLGIVGPQANAVLASGKSLSELLKMSDADLLSIPGIGEATVIKIQSALIV